MFLVLCQSTASLLSQSMQRYAAYTMTDDFPFVFLLSAPFPPSPIPPSLVPRIFLSSLSYSFSLSLFLLVLPLFLQLIFVFTFFLFLSSMRLPSFPCSLFLSLHSVLLSFHSPSPSAPSHSYILPALVIFLFVFILLLFIFLLLFCLLFSFSCPSLVLLFLFSFLPSVVSVSCSTSSSQFLFFLSVSSSSSYASFFSYSSSLVHKVLLLVRPLLVLIRPSHASDSYRQPTATAPRPLIRRCASLQIELNDGPQSVIGNDIWRMQATSV